MSANPTLAALTHPVFTRFRLTPYTPNIGATISEIDLSAPIDADTARELRLALAHYDVLFFRDQPLTPAQQVEVARAFGSPAREKAYFPASAEHELVELIEIKPDESSRYATDQWHSDTSYQVAPPAGAVLAAKALPETGGDTLWASARKVYQALPTGFAAWLETLTAMHSFEYSGWGDALRKQPGGEARYQEARVKNLPVDHPVVKTHPVTGEKFLFVNPKYTERIRGLTRTQSNDLLAYLYHFFERPEFQARFVWTPNAVAVWDNHTTIHCAVIDYLPAQRLMHRVTF
jgi:taurine dioxygenase